MYQICEVFTCWQKLASDNFGKSFFHPLCIIKSKAAHILSDASRLLLYTKFEKWSKKAAASDLIKML